MKKVHELGLIILAAFTTAFIAVFFAQSAIFSPDRTLQAVLMAKVFITSFNIVILGGLCANYIQIYRDMHSSLSRSLLIFSSALLFYAITSNPIIHVLAGFETISIGAFTFLPDLFVSFATLVILNESYK